MKKVVVTGGGGNIAYSLLFSLANGDLLGNQPISLNILEIPQMVESLKGVVMELQDCCFPMLQEVKIGSDPMEIFAGAEIVFLVGSRPRSPGMERKDLLSENGKIFVGQGKALNAVANRKDVHVLVVGNPCNTNCLIAMHHAPDIAPTRFHAMTRLDQNRATYQLAHKAGVPITDVSHVTIWGNHSSTQVPDFHNARIRGKKVSEVIKDKHWLEKEFFAAVQQRGAEVLKSRGKSSAASAAKAAIDAMKALIFPGSYFSSGILSNGNPYGIKNDLIFSFPMQNKEIVKGLELTPFLKEKLALTEKELLEERDLVKDLLKIH